MSEEPQRQARLDDYRRTVPPRTRRRPGFEAGERIALVGGAVLFALSRLALFVTPPA